MHRIYLIGASGTGKTTLARALSKKLGLVHFDSDDFYYFPTDPPFQKQRSPEERAELLSKALSKHQEWTLSGGAGTWEPPVLLDFTLVIFLSLPQSERLNRLLCREAELYGDRIRSGGDMEKTHQEFMQWTKGYEDSTAEGTNTRIAHEKFLSRVQVPILRLEHALSTEAQMKRVFESLRGFIRT